MKKKEIIKKTIYVLIAIVLLAAIYLNTYLIIKYNVLPMKYLIGYFALFGLIPIIFVFLTLFVKIKKPIRIISLIFEFIYIIILFVAFFYLNETFKFVDDFTNNYDYETKNYYVLALKDSGINNIEDLKNKNIGYAKSLDESVDKALKTLNKKVILKNNEYSNTTEILEDLYLNKVNSMLIADSFYNLFYEENNEIAEKTNIIYKFSIKEKIEETTKDVNVTKETFNVYISGIDSYDHITEKNRSDVNIVMSVNPRTNKILMINIPRDYYVEFAGLGVKDKLTHAGTYGVNMSVQTIENLLDININYYVKVNYNALIGIVDALDGVDVYSQYNFTSGQYYFHFKKGYNHVNGKQALEFVRTRKAFLQGDRVRGENQQAMIEAIIKKAVSPSILMKYNDILDSLKDSFTTNVSTENITSLIKMQLDKMPSWSFETLSLNGSDSHAYSPTYPGPELYVMEPNLETVQIAKEKLQNMK